MRVFKFFCSATNSNQYHLHLLAFIIVLFLPKIVGESTNLNYTKISSLRLERIRKHLDKINKPPILTIESPDGDLIDCIDKRKQLALDHPLLKNHKIQKAPTKMLKRINVKKDENIGDDIIAMGEGAWQIWHQNGTKCPKGTIPIRRNTVNDVLRAKSLYQFGKKHGRIPLSRNNDAPDIASVSKGHEHSYASTGSSEDIYGTKVTINVWDPSVEDIHEFSLSQLWIVAGSTGDVNTIEAGWQVYSEIYGDQRPRLFIYWTRDTYQQTGCYNLKCAGFVQTNSNIVLGGAITPVSSYGGTQSEITIQIWKESKQGNWWMSLGNNVLVGYWPKEIFTSLKDHATLVEWGGEVINVQPNGRHTSTQMGSGKFAEEGYGKASYFRNLQIVNVDNYLMSPQSISTVDEKSKCYNIKAFSNNDWGTFFFYGGPGNNPQCP